MPITLETVRRHVEHMEMCTDIFWKKTPGQIREELRKEWGELFGLEKEENNGVER